MFYVYILKSISNPFKNYIGYTTNIDNRMAVHNSGGSSHTKKYIPWQLVTYIAFTDEKKAIDFEKYLKIGSGKAFANKRFL